VAQSRPVARSRVLSLGFLTALFGLSLVLAVVVIQLVDGWWRFLLLLVPAVFAGLFAVEARRSAKSPDEQVPA
jgi:hypothetical protein